MARHSSATSPASSEPAAGLRRVILRGASWTTAAQLAPLVVNIVMTPYIIGHFGVARYGVFLLAGVVVQFLGSFDGGINSSVARWSAVYAGSDDRAGTTRLVTTLLAVVSVLGVVLSALLFVFAGPVLDLFHPPADVRDEGAFLLRVMGFIVGFAQVRGLFAAQLSARQQYAWQSITSIVCFGVYAIGLVVTVELGLGLRGAALTFVAQSVMATLLILPRSLRYLDRSSVGFMAWPDLREFLRYAFRVQLTGLTNIVNTQADTFIVGRLLSVSAIAVYGTGANFASQLRNVPINALGPISTALSAAYGRGGDREAVEVFNRLQRRWVQGCTAWCATALGAAYFGVSTWLGPQFELSGVVACLLTAANAVNLWTGMLTVLLSAVGRPGIEVRYAIVSVAVNIGLTIPLVLAFGLLGTVAATATGSMVASLYLVRLARTRYDPGLRSFLRDVPVLPAVVSVTVVVLLELLVAPVVPRGALGLVLCGVVAAPGLVVFAVVLLGPRPALTLARSRFVRATGGTAA